MVKYNKGKTKIIAVWVSALSTLLGCTQMSVDDFQLKNNEKPFSSLVLPIERVDAEIVERLGNVISGDLVIVVRLVDAQENEFFLAATRDASGKYDQVFWDLPLVWSEEPGVWGGIGLPPNPPEEEYQLKEITNSRDAIRDLINILSLFRDPDDPSTEGAYATLKRGYYGEFMYRIRGGDPNRGF